MCCEPGSCRGRVFRRCRVSVSPWFNLERAVGWREERRCPHFARKARVDIGPIAALPQVIAGAYPATPASPCARANLNALFRGPRRLGQRNAGNRLPPPAAGRRNPRSSLNFTRLVKTFYSATRWTPDRCPGSRLLTAPRRFSCASDPKVARDLLVSGFNCIADLGSICNSLLCLPFSIIGAARASAV